MSRRESASRHSRHNRLGGSDDDHHDKSHRKRSSVATEEEGDNISEDDYFRMNDEFRCWLWEYKNRKRRFMDLTDRDARKLFKRFVRQWNEGRLESKYYERKVDRWTETDAAQRTSYTWGFARNLEGNEAERLKLDSIRDEVDHVTFGSGAKTETKFRNRAPQGGIDQRHTSGMGRKRTHGGERGEAVEEDEDLIVTEEGKVLSKREMEHKRRRFEDKEFSKKVRHGLDEIAPRSDPGSFQRKLENRRERSQYARQNGEHDEDNAFSIQRDLMGDDGHNDYQALLRNERQRRQQREERQRDSRFSQQSSSQQQPRGSLSDRFHKTT